MINIENSCCFTGYRPDKYDFSFETDCPEYRTFCNRLHTAVAELIERGCTDFYCGMALGFDIVAGEHIALVKKLNKSIRLIGVVPYVGQERGFSAAWQKRYRELLAECDEVVTLNEQYLKWAFQQRNRYMVDRCRYVLTYFDGKAGGTKNTLEYATKNGREVINIHSTDPDKDIDSHLVCKYCLVPPENEKK